MLSRENRVLMGAMVLVVIAFLLLEWLSASVGLEGLAGPLAGFLLVVGLGVAAPQLYLAKTDSSRAPTTRLRIVVFLTVVFAFVFVLGASPFEQLVILGVTGLLVVGWFGYELKLAIEAARERGDFPTLEDE
ncbi:hypothetical protein OB919_19420 [Halobacteria archaeon AArc-curdl1]|uniref:Uncharacterized protein n=1 Tax=Natronosalvus hydrolyticus TaxID=2979988 RepID=A0AAP3E8Q0_9EURY|nr:hypothetical protein [Halobacteria archaeon AArc-curdl1]